MEQGQQAYDVTNKHHRQTNSIAMKNHTQNYGKRITKRNQANQSQTTHVQKKNQQPENKHAKARTHDMGQKNKNYTWSTSTTNERKTIETQNSH